MTDIRCCHSYVVGLSEKRSISSPVHPLPFHPPLLPCVSSLERHEQEKKIETSKCQVYKHPVFLTLTLLFFASGFMDAATPSKPSGSKKRKKHLLCVLLSIFPLSNSQGFQPSCFSRLIKIPHKAQPHFVLIKSKKGLDLKQTQWLKETSSLQAGKGQKNKNWIWFY